MNSAPELADAVEAFLTAYRAKYLATNRIRANAPLRQEAGELKIALNAYQAAPTPPGGQGHE